LQRGQCVGAELIDAGFDVTVVKLDGVSGAEEWHRYLDGTAHEFDFGNDVAVDAQRNVVVVGEIVNQGTRSDVLAVKLGPDGDEIWRTEIDGGRSGYDSGNAVAIVGQRVVVAAGSDGKTYDDTRFAALGLDAATGAEAWRQVEQGDAGGRDWTRGVAAGTAGGVFVMGDLVHRGTKNDGLVLDLDAANGAARWRLIVNETVPDSDVAEAVAVDAHGDAIAVGRIGSARKAEDFTVVKLAGSSGAPLWRASIDGAIGAKRRFGRHPQSRPSKLIPAHQRCHRFRPNQRQRRVDQPADCREGTHPIPGLERIKNAADRLVAVDPLFGYLPPRDTCDLLTAGRAYQLAHLAQASAGLVDRQQHRDAARGSIGRIGRQRQRADAVEADQIKQCAINIALTTPGAQLGRIGLAQIGAGNAPRARLKACGEHLELLLRRGRNSV
jgi:hypothetical protein